MVRRGSWQWVWAGLAIVVLVGVVLPSCSGGFASKLTEMDRHTGRRREIRRILSHRLSTREVEPLWIAEFAPDAEPDWVPVAADFGPRGPRVQFTWGGTHATVLMTMSPDWDPLSKDARGAFAGEIIRVMTDYENAYVVRSILNDATSEVLFDIPDRGEVVTPELVRATFRRVEAGQDQEMPESGVGQDG